MQEWTRAKDIDDRDCGAAVSISRQLLGLTAHATTN